jgi:hypothetical protein
MTDEQQPVAAALESFPVWIAKTAGYVALIVFACVVLANATMSFFFEKTNLAVGGGIGGAIGAVVASRRRHLLARKSDTP